MSEDEIRILRADFPGITESCLQKLKLGGPRALPDGVDKCFEMVPRQRWRGWWHDDFEGSRFCAAPAPACSASSPGEFIWLTFQNGGRLDPTKPFGAVYEVDFIGRRTKKRGKYGHLGIAEHEIVVDDLLSIRPVRRDEHVPQNEH